MEEIALNRLARVKPAGPPPGERTQEENLTRSPKQEDRTNKLDVQGSMGTSRSIGFITNDNVVVGRASISVSSDGDTPEDESEEGLDREAHRIDGGEVGEGRKEGR